MYILTSAIVVLLLLRGSFLEIVSPTLYSLLNLFTFIALISFLFILIVKGDVKIKLINVLILFGLFFLMLASSIYNFESIKNGGWNALATLFVLFLLSIARPNADGFDFSRIERSYFIITTGFLIVSYILYFSGIQFASSHTQYILSGPYLNQNTMSVNLFCLSIIGCLIFRCRNKYYLIPLLLIVFLSVFLTMSRAGALFSIFVAVVFFGRNKVILFSPFLAAIGLFFIPENFYTRLVSKASEAGTSGRFDFINQVFLNKLDNIGSLFFGTGVNNTVFKLHGETLSAHNSFISFFSDFGLLCFIFLFVYIIIILLKAKKKIMLYMIFLLGYAFFETILFKGLSLSFFLFCLLANYEHKKTYTNNTF